MSNWSLNCSLMPVTQAGSNERPTRSRAPWLLFPALALAFTATGLGLWLYHRHARFSWQTDPKNWAVGVQKNAVIDRNWPLGRIDYGDRWELGPLVLDFPTRSFVVYE